MASKGSNPRGPSKATPKKLNLKASWSKHLKAAQDEQAAAKLSAKAKGRKFDAPKQWARQLLKARKEQERAKKAAGLKTGPSLITRKVRTTRNTALHGQIRNEFDEREERIERALRRRNISKQMRGDLLWALAVLKDERERQKTDPRVSVRTGLIQGGSESVIVIDQHRGSTNSIRDRPRAIHSGNSLLGTMEGWAAVVTVLSAEPFGAGIPKDWKPDPIPADVMERIKSLPQLLGIPDAEKPEWIRKVAELWAVCEAFGALVVFELDYDSDKKGS